MSSRQRLLIWLVFGSFFCPVMTGAGAAVTTSPSQRLPPVWRVLLLAYRQVDVDYADDGGKQHHFSNKLPDEELQAAVWSFRQSPSLAYKHSKGEVLIQYDIVYPAVPLAPRITGRHGTKGDWFSGYPASPTPTEPDARLVGLSI